VELVTAQGTVGFKSTAVETAGKIMIDDTKETGEE
jgi:hypothetical protein